MTQNKTNYGFTWRTEQFIYRSWDIYRPYENSKIIGRRHPVERDMLVTRVTCNQLLTVRFFSNRFDSTKPSSLNPNHLVICHGRQTHRESGPTKWLTQIPNGTVVYSIFSLHEGQHEESSYDRIITLLFILGLWIKFNEFYTMLKLILLSRFNWVDYESTSRTLAFVSNISLAVFNSYKNGKHLIV